MTVPTVPNPNVAPVQYLQPQYPQPPFPAPGSGTQPADRRNDLQSGQNIQQLVSVLTDSPYPALRETAATTLASSNANNPQVLPVLLQSACKDQAVSVRVACINCLSRMNVANEPNVVTTLRGLQNDPDPRVRHEVQEAFQRLGVNP